MALGWIFNPFSLTLDAVQDVSSFGTGDVTGPGGAVDNQVARFDMATGKIIQTSLVKIDDSGNLTPNSAGGQTVGTAALPFNKCISLIYELRTAGAADRGMLSSGGTFPSATSAYSVLVGPSLNPTLPIGIYSQNNGNVDANATGTIRIETGNKTAGTGNSGNIELMTGTSSGGIRGYVGFHNSKFKISLNEDVYWYGGPNPAIIANTTSIADSNLGIFYGSSDVTTNIYTNDVILQTGTNLAVGATQATGQITIVTGTQNDSGSTGSTGSIEAFTGDNSGSGSSGAMTYQTGGVTGTLNNTSGGLTFQTGGNNSSGVSSNTGNIIIRTGANTGSGNTGSFLFETGNSSSSNSGNMTIRTGTASGTRGYIQFDSLVAVLPTGTGDPSTSYPNGSCYYNTSDNTLRILNGGTWRSVTLA